LWWRQLKCANSRTDQKLQPWLHSLAIFSVDVAADAANQDAYVTVLFEQSELLNAEFIIWFSLLDFDALWYGILNQDPVARIWRDTGLYDQNLIARPALGNWQRQLGITLDPDN